MNKPFLLIMGYTYYPQQDTGDWKGVFSSYEEAKNSFEEETFHEYYGSGKKKGEIKSSHTYYTFKGGEYDWYEIVDLRDLERMFDEN